MSYSSDIAFSKTVKAIQSRKGSRSAYAQMEKNGSWASEVTPKLREFIAEQRSFFLASGNLEGQPYIQHRGGPPGFLKILDKHTMAFADYKGNRQFITQGNLADNPKAFIFLIDYSRKARVKIWGTAEVIENDLKLLELLLPAPGEYRAIPEQIIRFHIEAFDFNCPQHIPQRFEAEDVERALKEKEREISALKKRVRELEKAIKP
ncbi:pyridoxamine 5'-phosphate oxidase family protein [Pseudoteredinibacter isoporae]|uniref:pyridoxamine 5'-phosphate oxidase family protein n=1 Tax=Pseudoteredinibacter isoporae TaxID=570281 RepID=UPI00310BE3EB